MGNFVKKLRQVFGDLGTAQARILMLGLDSAGKTTVLYKIKLNENVTCTVPTVGFNVETVAPVHGLTFTVWDVGGQDRLRPLWKHYYRNVDGLVYVVDSSDRERMEEARDELFGILGSEDMRGVPLVVLANKQDIPTAFNAAQITDQLNLNKLTGRRWYVHGTCATNGNGVFEGMGTLATLVKQQQKEGNPAL